MLTQKPRTTVQLPIAPDKFVLLKKVLKAHRKKAGLIALRAIESEVAELDVHSQKQATPDSHKPVADAAKGGAR